ncbi:MAG: HD domain-containing protein [Firmicutes bacterium]|nr:HD domain-containing protein [Bacillota bacterium]
MKKRNVGVGRFILCMILSLLLAAQAVFISFASGTVLNASGVTNRPVSVDPTGRTEGFSAVLYNNTNGLPTSEANAIAETSEGFIWIGSYGGLIRYDGNTFTRMDSTTGLSSVKCLYVDSRDRLWIGTNDNGIAVMERGELQQWGKLDGMKSAHTRAIAEDDNGTIYIATTCGIAMIDPEGSLKMMEGETVSDANMRDLRKGADGIIYGLTNLGDLMRIRDGAVISFLSTEDSGIKGVGSILPDPETPGKIYFEGGDFCFYHATLGDTLTDLEPMDIQPLSYVQQIEYIDGKIWICSSYGIGVLDGNGIRVLDNLPMSNSVGHVMTDYQGNLWFTSTRQGVMKVVPNQFSNLFDRFGLPERVVNSTCMLDGKLFVATDNGLIVIGSNGPLSSLRLKESVTVPGADAEADDLIALLDGCRIRSIIRDSKDRLWIATWRKYGLLCYDHGQLITITNGDSPISNSIRAACEREDGTILMALTGGVSVIDGDRIIANYTEKDGITDTESLCVCEGTNGDIVLGSNGGGIYIIDSSGVKQTINVEDGLPSDIVMRLKRDPNRDIIWIVTSSAIAYMTPDYKVTTVNKFPYTNNFDMCENSKGDMWVLSSNGIYVTPTEELLANEDINPVYYSIANGIPCITTANSYSDVTPEGDLYIAGSTGICKVNIESSFENVNDLKVAVPFVDIDGERLYPNEDGSFTIPSDMQKLTVHSFVYSYSLSNPQVSYQLEGFEQHSTTVNRSELMPVDYTNLRGGKYNFVIQLHDSMGRGNKEVSVSIVKEKAFYEQTWFLIGAGLLLLLIIAAFVRLYVKRKTQKLLKKQQENMTFIREITEAFAKVIDMKDKYTNGHSTRVAKYTAMLAEELGYDEETVEKYYRIALLHDIGKIGVPPEVLNKNGKLTDEEFEIIKSHTSQGYEALKDISIMPELSVGAQAHHERPDGRGYPNHLKGDEIPRVAQIIAVADCFDAMYSNRPYRNRMNFDKVVSIIKEVSGTQLEADVVQAFLRLVDKGELRDPDDHGGGSTENIENIRNKQ